jgi:hypothetical protein
LVELIASHSDVSQGNVVQVIGHGLFRRLSYQENFKEFAYSKLGEDKELLLSI